MAMTILYPVGKQLYVNLTNRCPCNCTFCIRHNGDGAYGSDSLWLEHEPTFEEVKTAFSAYDLSQWTELVFCGYGEPTSALELLLQTAAYAKSQKGCPPVRLNTNGLADLIHGRSTAADFAGKFDVISISLNAGTEMEYMAVTRPKWKNAFTAMQAFATSVKSYVPKVMFTVVDVIPKEEIAAAQAVADAVGIPLRVREYIAE